MSGNRKARLTDIAEESKGTTDFCPIIHQSNH